MTRKLTPTSGRPAAAPAGKRLSLSRKTLKDLAAGSPGPVGGKAIRKVRMIRTADC